MKEQRFFLPVDRYFFDFKECHFKKGFAQIDTSEDASWFGTWANPETLRIVEYLEGDVIIKDTETIEEFTNEIRRMADWHKEQGNTFAIDCMQQTNIYDSFSSAGLKDLLHQGRCNNDVQ